MALLDKRKLSHRSLPRSIAGSPRQVGAMASCVDCPPTAPAWVRCTFLYYGDPLCRAHVFTRFEGLGP